jgi:hypothetical protein
MEKKCAESVDYVPFVPLTGIDLQLNLRIMSEGNTILRDCSEKLIGKRKGEVFGKKIFSGEIREIEMDMIQGFSPLIIGRAAYQAKFCVNYCDRLNVFADLHQEANLKFLDCIYGYIGESAKFITYAWDSLQRHLQRVSEKMKAPMLPPTADSARELLIKFEKFRREYNGPLSFDVAAELMGLDQDQQEVVTKALATVINQTDLILDSGMHDGDHEGNDYTALEVRQERLYQDSPADVDWDKVQQIKDSIKLAKLSDFEADLLIAYSESKRDHGWRAEVARKHNKSRYAATLAYERACDKVRAALKANFG